VRKRLFNVPDETINPLLSFPWSFISATILSAVLYVNIPGIIEISHLADAWVYLPLLLLICWYCFVFPAQLTMTRVELAGILLFIYIYSNSLFHTSFYVFPYFKFACLLLFYFSVKRFLVVYPANYTSHWLVRVFLLLFAFYAVSGIYFLQNQQGMNRFFSPNSSIYSILLASQIIFAIPLCIYSCRTFKPGCRVWVYGFISVFILVCMTMLILTKGRAGWIGFFAGTVYLIIKATKKTKRTGTLIPGIAISALLIFCLVFFYKKDSSEGRALIYRVSAQMVHDHLLFGIGNGQFKNNYNEYQADYFTASHIDEGEALLADNTFYAFNDYWQLMIENGITGLLLMGVFIGLLIVRVKKITTTGENKGLFMAAVSSLLCVFVTALFSYPYQNLPVLVQAVFCLAIINSFSIKDEKLFTFSFSEIISGTGKLLFCFTLLVIEYYFIVYKYKSREAFTLSMKGHRANAIHLYRELANSCLRDGNNLYLYAQELYYSKKLKLAVKILEIQKDFYVDHKYYTLIAQINKELGNYQDAESAFQRAINMVPNRIVSRRNIMWFYYERHDTSKVISWARSILGMSIKVPSETILRSQQEAAKMIRELSRIKN
jgi:O-antigen ligase